MTKQHPVEGDVKKAIKDLLDRHGWFHFMPPANTYGKSGISDILAIKGGRFMALEVKLKKKVGTTNQQTFMQSIRDHGGIALLVNQANLEKFENLLRVLDGVSHGETA